MGARRIDALYCTQETAKEKIETIISAVGQRAKAVRDEVSEVIWKRIKALEAREKELMDQIDQMAEAKVQALRQQLSDIHAGKCPCAPSEDPDLPPDPTRFLVNADEVISFRLGEEDFLEKLGSFGTIGEASTYASGSYANGPALGVLKVNNPSYIWVVACDRMGQRRKEGGNTVTAVLSSPGDFQDVEVEDTKDGRYKLKFMPLTPGDFTLDIVINSEGQDESISGAPFQLCVRNPTEYALIGTGDEEAAEGKMKLGTEGDPHSLDVLGQMHHPSGVDFDATGNFLFVSDQSNNRIQVFHVKDQQPLCSFGKKGFGLMDFDTPCDVVVDRENRVIVSDLLNHRLQVLEYLPKEGRLQYVCTVGEEGTGLRQFQFPKGLAIAETGHVLVCDSANHRVQVLDSTNNFELVKVIGSYGEQDGQFNAPLDVTLNCQGEIIISDSTNRIQVFDPQGVFSRSFGNGTGRQDGMFKYPTSMAVNDENALFVCDQGNHRVQVLSASDGSFLHKWGGHRKKPKAGGEEDGGAETEPEDPDKPPEWGGIKKPAGIAVNTYGTIVVTDYHLNTMFVF